MRAGKLRMQNISISWTECCYAFVFAERFHWFPGHPFERGFDRRLVPNELDKHLRTWKISAKALPVLRECGRRDGHAGDSKLWPVELRQVAIRQFPEVIQ